MADIQLVIKICEEHYNAIKKGQNEEPYVRDFVEAIGNGTPLPKGHGELIERNKIEYLKAIHDAKYGYITWGDAVTQIKYSAPTIIEADTESEEEHGNI